MGVRGRESWWEAGGVGVIKGSLPFICEAVQPRCEVPE